MKRKKSKKTGSPMRTLMAVIAVLVAAAVALQFVYPDVRKLKRVNPKLTSLMKYRMSEWKREGKKYRIDQVWVPYKAISTYLIKAVLIGEDDKFWHHDGFDYEAMEKAMEKDIKAGRFKLGGSTITQQLAKNLYLSPSKNPARKVREAIITWRLERTLSKRRILEIYLNVAEWGPGGIFGIEAAARHYYGKHASELGPEESARLAAILPNPRRFNPLGDEQYVVHRANLIYRIMVRRGIVVPEYEEMEEDGGATAPSATQPLNTPIEDLQPSR